MTSFDTRPLPWRPSTAAAPPLELRRPVAGRLVTTAVTTGAFVALLLVLGLFIDPLGPILLAVGVVACGFCVTVWILYTGAVESLVLRERVLLQRRWWGAVQRTRAEDVATVVYLPKYGQSTRDGWEYRPFLVLLDSNGHRLHRLACARWSEEQLETLAAALPPKTTKLKVPGRVDAASLRRLDQEYPGIRRR